MQLREYLNSLSIDDLRELALRRGMPAPEGPGGGRQTLVRNLSAALDRPDSVYGAVTRLNQGELGVLHAVVKAGPKAGLSALSRESGVEAGVLKGHLESLRLYGLLFPEGDWEHIALPNATKGAAHYLPGRRPEPLGELVRVPDPEPAPGVQCQGRPGSIGRDMAEMLARIARGRLKLTQAGRMNRRDLKAMEPAFGIQARGYSWFLYVLTSATGILAANPEGMLVVEEAADVFLAQPETGRAAVITTGWSTMRAYPETVSGDPADFDYIPVHLPEQRTLAFTLLRGSAATAPVTVNSLAAALVWSMPLTFQHWSASLDAGRVVPRLLRSLYWLGIAALDDPEKPTAAQCTPLFVQALEVTGERVEDLPQPIPEEPRFFIQPNAEVFAPPNLSPRAFFHLRRITGEKKGAPEGVYPLTADSIRRALDTGLTVEAVTTFLERFSRTGLPANVRSLVETTGRQHGRIRLIPTGYVLVTDGPQLLEELRRVKPIEPLLGKPVTERVTAVEAAQVNELLRTLRQKGYAPLNEAETGDAPSLPDSPEAIPEIPGLSDEDVIAIGPDGEPITAGALTALLTGLVPTDPEDLPPPATTPAEIRNLLRYAVEEEMWVEIDLQPPGLAEPEEWEILPLRVTSAKLSGITYDEDDNEIEETIPLGQIRGARLIEVEDEF